MSNFTPSEKQQAIFDFGTQGTGSAIVVAVAGAGKTTTLVEMFKRMPEQPGVLMLAFNKSIADELKSRVPGYVQAATFHSIGNSVWQRYVARRVQVDGNKVRSIMAEVMAPREMALYGSFVAKMVSLAKGSGMGALVNDTEAEWNAISAHFDVTPDNESAKIERGIELARMVLRQSIEEARSVIDFDDMLFMPLIENCAFPKQNIVCIDEAQDTNGVQRALLKRMLALPHGRLIAVGDPKQAIYGFRGADSSAMEIIKEEFGCIELPLTVSYRCPQEVVKKAQEIVPYIEAHPSAPMGSVSYNPGKVDESGKFIPQAFRANDAIICRNAAPLITAAYLLIGKRVPCQILGRDIGKSLVELVKKMGAGTIDSLIEKLGEYERREVDRMISRDQAEKAEALRDKVACLHICINSLYETNRTVSALIASIEALFSDKDQGVLTLCTVHKAKGLEWERVYVLDAAKLMPSKWARLPWQKEQESNLMYVAWTRAKLELNFIASEDIEKVVEIVEAPKPVKVSEEAVQAVEARKPGEIRVGDKVEVVKGKNVPLRTKGKVTKCFGEPWFGIALVDANGKEHKTYQKNVKIIEA